MVHKDKLIGEIRILRLIIKLEIELMNIIFPVLITNFRHTCILVHMKLMLILRGIGLTNTN